jgi:hypothetical protein
MAVFLAAVWDVPRSLHINEMLRRYLPCYTAKTSAQLCFQYRMPAFAQLVTPATAPPSILHGEGEVGHYHALWQTDILSIYLPKLNLHNSFYLQIHYRTPTAWD